MRRLCGAGCRYRGLFKCDDCLTSKPLGCFRLLGHLESPVHLTVREVLRLRWVRAAIGMLWLLLLLPFIVREDLIRPDPGAIAFVIVLS